MEKGEKMESISTVSTEIVQHAWTFSAHVVLNGNLTSQECTHYHSTRELAEKCRSKVQARWEAIAKVQHTVKPVDGYPNLHEVRYSETREVSPNVFRNREVWCRFLFIKKVHWFLQ